MIVILTSTDDRSLMSYMYIINVFYSYNYSNSFTLRVWMIKVKSWIKFIVKEHKRLHNFSLLTVNFKYIEQNNTYSLEHMFVENMLLFKINYKNVSSEWTVTISEQVRTNDTSLSTCVTPDINWTSPNSDK